MHPQLTIHEVKTSLLALEQSVRTGSRYTYGDHLQLNGTYEYGGVGSLTYSNAKDKVSLQVFYQKPQLTMVYQDFAPVTPDTTVVLFRGMPMGLLLSLTYPESIALN